MDNYFECKMQYITTEGDTATHTYRWAYGDGDKYAKSIASERKNKDSKKFKNFLTDELEAMVDDFKELLEWEVIL